MEDISGNCNCQKEHSYSSEYADFFSDYNNDADLDFWLGFIILIIHIGIDILTFYIYNSFLN